MPGSLHGLTTLVCNTATLTPSKTVEELRLAQWQAALWVNLTSAFIACKYGIRHLRDGGVGSIVITASQMGRVAWMGSAPYCATKGALIQFAKVLALDHATATAYERDGFVFPYPVISKSEAQAIRADLEAGGAALADNPADLALLRSYPDRLLPSL